MAKGLGGIMAAVAMAQAKSEIESGEALACPICGCKMDVGVAFFCYGDMAKDAYGALHPCVESTHSYVKEAFYAWYSGYGVDEAWQGAVIAAIVDNTDTASPKILAELRNVRGPRGKTNMSCDTFFGSDVELKDIPLLAKKFGWTFQDWYPEN